MMTKPTSISDLRVLVIDDHRAMRKIVRQLLSKVGIDQVVEAEDGTGALKLLTANGHPEVDAVICDLHMLPMDGLEFCNRIRRSDDLRARHMPILMLTAETDEMMLEVVRQVGAADVAHKPISALDLAAKLARLIGLQMEVPPPNPAEMSLA